MDKFNWLTYLIAMFTVGGGIFGFLWQLIKKGTPYVRSYIDKFLEKLDNVIEESEKQTASFNQAIFDSECDRKKLNDTQKKIVEVLEKQGDMIEKNAEMIRNHEDRISIIEKLKESKLDKEE